MKFSASVFSAIVLAASSFSAQAAVFTLVTAAQDNSPKFIKQNGKMEGIAIDAMRAIEKIDPELKFSGEQTFLPIKRIEIGLSPESATGPEHLDVFFGLGKTPEREKKFHYVEPQLYAVRNVLFVRANETAAPKSLEEIKQVTGDATVLANNGYMQATTVRAVPGLKVDDGGKTNGDNLNKLIQGRARFFYAAELTGLYEAKQLGLSKQIKTVTLPGDEVGQYVATSNSLPKPVLAKLEAAIKKLISSGEMDKILSKYK